MGSESTYSECETFTDEDTGTLVHHGAHDELETDSAIDATLNSEFTDTLEEPENSVVFNGEIKNRALSPSTLLYHSTDHGRSDCGFNSMYLPIPDDHRFLANHDHFTSTLQSVIGEEMLEFYCTQCHKQINRLEDLSTRINTLEMNRKWCKDKSSNNRPIGFPRSVLNPLLFLICINDLEVQWEMSSAINISSKSHFHDPASCYSAFSPIMRLSSKKVARHLQQNSADSIDRMENLSTKTLGLVPLDLTDQVIFLEKRVTELEQDNTTSGEMHNRLRQENLQLVHRANALEEQLKEQETRSEQMLLEELKKQKESLSKVEREQVIEIESLHT
eukprot:g47129.t1